MKVKLFTPIVLGLITLISNVANAGLITGTGDISTDSNLVGGTVIDFESSSLGSFPSLIDGNVTITSNGFFEISNNHAGQFNTTGQYLENGSDFTPSTWYFDFAVAVDVFAFNMGAHDESWSLSVFNGANLLETIEITAVGGSELGQYYGIYNSGITRAELSNNGGDWVMIDNLTYIEQDQVEVPEPSTLAILALGMMGLASRRFKKQS